MGILTANQFRSRASLLVRNTRTYTGGQNWLCLRKRHRRKDKINSEIINTDSYSVLVFS